jgi:hypothetical protein
VEVYLYLLFKAYDDYSELVEKIKEKNDLEIFLNEKGIQI